MWCTVSLFRNTTSTHTVAYSLIYDLLIPAIAAVLHMHEDDKQRAQYLNRRLFKRPVTFISLLHCESTAQCGEQWFTFVAHVFVFDSSSLCSVYYRPSHHSSGHRMHCLLLTETKKHKLHEKLNKKVCYGWLVALHSGRMGGGAENAGVEKAKAITYGKPSEHKILKTPGV